jgi:hypothetical protein
MEWGCFGEKDRLAIVPALDDVQWLIMSPSPHFKNSSSLLNMAL